MAISRNIYYRTTHYIKHQTVKVYQEAIAEVMGIYNHEGMRVSHIHANNEFRAVLDPIKDAFMLHVNYANLQDHVPEVKHNNRTNERIHVGIYDANKDDSENSSHGICQEIEFFLNKIWCF